MEYPGSSSGMTAFANCDIVAKGRGDSCEVTAKYKKNL